MRTKRTSAGTTVGTGGDDPVVRGEGPVATVLAGVDPATGEPYALKIFPGPLDRRTRAKLDAERGRLSAGCAQAAVLLADRVESMPDGRCALRMELCAQSLPDLLTSVGSLSVPDTLVLGTVLASALAAVHRAGVVHGGVTGANVLFRSTGEPMLSDVGATLRHAYPRDPLPTVELTAPETVRDGCLDERTDLYGLGVVLHLALAGRAPHLGRPGEDRGERLLRVLGSPVPPLTRADAPPELVALVSQLLAKEPDARPVDAATVAARLDALRRQVPPAAPEPIPGSADPVRRVPAGPDLGPAETDRVAPEPQADRLAPKPQADRLAPRPPADRLAPKPPADRLAPKPPADRLAPKPPADRLAPKPPADRVAPRPPAVSPDPSRAAAAPAPATAYQPTATAGRAPAAGAGPEPVPGATPEPVATPARRTAGPPDGSGPGTDRDGPPVGPPTRPPGPDLAAAACPSTDDAALDDFAGAQPAGSVTDPPPGEPIVAVGSAPPARRPRRAALLAGAAGVTLLATSAALLVDRPAELTVPPPGPAVAGDRPPTPPAVRLELSAATDRGNVVELSWRSSEPMDFAVVVAVEGERARVLLARRETSYRVPVDPVRRYCFRVQGSDGARVVQSEARAIRGANCLT
ncbi:serine/threonine protein kinase [Plantactinospora sp. WMMB782]|uniref:serine/threonine protein kinase n=1 Tax=Plantactinospora sp. WMMB782 TaxID=3404121 RepID=UPI003B95DDB4